MRKINKWFKVLCGDVMVIFKYQYVVAFICSSGRPQPSGIKVLVSLGGQAGIDLSVNGF
jgi:hypothetical protein